VTLTLTATNVTPPLPVDSYIVEIKAGREVIWKGVVLHRREDGAARLVLDIGRRMSQEGSPCL
jgi:hypothetical protein